GGRGRVQGHLVGEDLELLVASDEVGLALDFDHGPDLVVGVDVGGDNALVGAATFALGGGGLPLHPQQLDRPVDVAVGLDQRRFRIHHRRPGPIPERLHVSSSNAHFDSPSLSAFSPSVPWAASALSAGGAGGCSSDGFTSSAAGCSPATVGAGFSTAGASALSASGAGGAGGASPPAACEDGEVPPATGP